MKRLHDGQRSVTVKGVVTSSVIGLALLINGCTGDERPFEEAVEVERLGIRSLEILRPVGGPEAFSIGVGERVALGLTARGSGGADEDGVIDLDGDDREWRSADPSVAQVTRDGVITGLSDGVTGIDVRIGNVVAERLAVQVSDGTLASISSIEGPDMPDACLPARYVAVGAFDDGTSRLLGDIVQWDVAGGASLRGREADDLAAGSIRLVPTGTEAPMLVARAGAAELARTFPVPTALTDLSLPDDLQALRVDQTLQLVATASYAAVGDAAARSVDVTDGVEWSVSGGEAVSVSNESPNRGLVRGLESGDATVQALCGASVATARIGVDASADDDDDGLAIQTGRTLELSVGGPNAQLRVSTGDEYDSERDVTERTDFRSEDVNLVTVDNFAPNKGLVRPGLITGTTRIIISVDGETESVTVTVR